MAFPIIPLSSFQLSPLFHSLLRIYSPSWAHRRLFFNAFFRLVRSANFSGETVVAYGLAVLVATSDAALTLIQLPLGLPTYLYTLLIGLTVGIIIACIAGKHKYFESRSIGFLEKIELSMATILTIPADTKDVDFPFPGGATFKLYVSFLILSNSSITDNLVPDIK